MQKNNNNIMPRKPWFLGLALVALIGGAFLLSALVMRDSDSAIFCRLQAWSSAGSAEEKAAGLQLNAIRHYATSKVVPQQSFGEISITFDVIKSLGRPFNFLVFGLGYDSLMWASFNPRGTTLFLEEDPEWVRTVLKDFPYLRAHTVKYRTKLSESNQLINMHKTEPACYPKTAVLRGNNRCKLALDMLPGEVYDREWDLIMIDAPKGYFPEAPGRMAAIYSAAIMARNRKGSGVTHVFLHDVDRPVEKAYAEMFLCRKYLVKGVGRLWHFEIPPSNGMNDGFC